jgi:cytochrome c oxidase subunit II
MRTTVVLRAAVLIGLTALGVALALSADAGDERVIKIVAKKFNYTPDVIMLKKGEPVTLEFTALDFTHGFKVPDLGIRADLPPGRPVVIHLTPEKTGRFTFLCDNFCGSGHEEMNGTIIVEE